MSATTQNPRPGSMAHQRRSQRILLSLPVIIAGKRENGSSFSERTRTMVVNAHGALLLLSQPVVVGQALNITNVATGEAAACNVKDTMQGQEETQEIGIEFSQPNPRFWRVSFPPPGWSSRYPEAKRFDRPSAPTANPAPEVKK